VGRIRASTVGPPVALVLLGHRNARPDARCAAAHRAGYVAASGPLTRSPNTSIQRVAQPSRSLGVDFRLVVRRGRDAQGSALRADRGDHSHRAIRVTAGPGRG